MDIRIACQPAYSIAYLTLRAGEDALVEAGAMAMMSAGLSVSAGLGSGGTLGAMARRVAGGEGLIMGRYTAQIDGAWIGVAPKFPGDIAAEQLTGREADELLIESGALLAADGNVNVDVKLAGLGSVVLREGATVLRASGLGTVVFGAYGGMQRFELAEGQTLIVDTSHAVAWTRSLGLTIGPLGSIVTSALVGEGLVGVYEGPGTIWVQTRAEAGLRSFLLPERNQNAGR